MLERQAKIEMQLRGKKAIITAAASGMGRAGCRLFAKEGAAIAAIDIDADRCVRMESEIRAEGGQCKAFIADLSKAASCKSAIDAAASWLGHVDILWSHAGSPALAGIEDVDAVQFESDVALNLGSAVHTTSQALRYMSRGGSLLYTASVSGLVASPRSPIYAALKFGVVGYMKSVALRLAERGIRANALCPGPIETPMLGEFAIRRDESGNLEQKLQALAQTLPMGRVGTPQEVANAALWLASDAASYVTGVAIPIDGGLSAR